MSFVAQIRRCLSTSKRPEETIYRTSSIRKTKEVRALQFLTIILDPTDQLCKAPKSVRNETGRFVGVAEEAQSKQKSVGFSRRTEAN